MTSAQRWKKQEREVAKLLDGERLPNNGKSQADVVTPLLAIQVKTRKTVPQWLWDAVDQATRDADGKVPVVVLSEVNQGKKARRLAVIDLEVFAGVMLWSVLHNTG